MAMESNHPIVLFDGMCNLCSGAVQFIIKRDPAGKFKFASLQSDYGIKCMKIYDVKVTPEPNSILLIQNGKLRQKSTAIIEIGRGLTGICKLAVIGYIIPPFLRDALYQWVAKNRYMWFGKKNECWIPTPELRNRFIE